MGSDERSSTHQSVAELVTLAVLQALLGYTSESRWLRHARAGLGHLFPYLPGQSGYNKRLRAAGGLVSAVIRVLAADLARAHQVGEGGEGLLDVGVRVGPVDLVQIDVIGLQPAQRVVERADEPAP